MEFDRPFEKITDKLEGWIEALFSMLPNMVIAILLLILFILLAKMSKRISFKLFGRATNDRVIQDLLAKFVYFIVFGLGLFFILEILKLHKAVTSLLAGIGVVGLALGFAFQDIVANFIAGIILAFRKPYVLDDIVEINNIMGTVVRSNLRSTVVKTFQGQEVYIPNRLVLQNPIYNFTVLGKRRVDLSVGISYAQDLDHVEQTVKNVIDNLDFVIDKENTMFDYHGFGDSSINFNIRSWVNCPGDKPFPVYRSEIIKAIKKAFNEEGITIPFPIRTLDFGIKGGEKLSDMRMGNN